MVPATIVELVDGLEADYLSGVGVLDPADDTAVYDKKYVHTDVLVVGAGPAGLTAAWEAAATGARVILIDDQPELGGSLLSDPNATVYGLPAAQWLTRIGSQLSAGPEVTVLTRTNAFGSYDANYVMAPCRTAPTTSAPPPPDPTSPASPGSGCGTSGPSR